MPDDRFNEYCEALLAQYTRKNTQTVTQRLESLCGFLRQKGNVVQTMFGGSVRKGTYVTGLSDVDALLIVNQSSLVNQPPARAIEYVRDTIQDRLRQNTVSAGNLAVTVSYSDRIEIQILPAIRTNSGGVRIADPGSNQWSNVARPDDFARKLAKVNTARDGRVVSIIKLAKAMADCFISRPSRKDQWLPHGVSGDRRVQGLSRPPRPEEHAHSPIGALDGCGEESNHRFHGGSRDTWTTNLAEQIRGLASGLQLTLGRCAAKSTRARPKRSSTICSAKGTRVGKH